MHWHMDNNGLNNTFHFIIQYNGNWTFVTAECILTHHVITICRCENQIDDRNDLIHRKCFEWLHGIQNKDEDNYRYK